MQHFFGLLPEIRKRVYELSMESILPGIIAGLVVLLVGSIAKAWIEAGHISWLNKPETHIAILKVVLAAGIISVFCCMLLLFLRNFVDRLLDLIAW